MYTFSSFMQIDHNLTILTLGFNDQDSNQSVKIQRTASILNFA